jgi:hypothetical protein
LTFLNENTCDQQIKFVGSFYPWSSGKKLVFHALTQNQLRHREYNKSVPSIKEAKQKESRVQNSAQVGRVCEAAKK